jgi:ATP-dependent DNA helicase RecG
VNLPAPTTLGDLEWIPPKKVAGLRRLGLETLGDLLLHLPRRYEDRRQFDRLPQVDSHTPVCLHGTVLKTSVKRFGGWRQCFEAEMEAGETGSLTDRWTCRWFNSNYLSKIILGGDRLVVFGKTKTKSGRIFMEHPEFEVLEEDQDLSVHFGRITPVHPAGEGIPIRLLRTLIHHAIETTDLSTIESLLPLPLPDEEPFLNLPPLPDAMRWIHFPDEFSRLEEVRPRLILEEFFLLQARLLRRRGLEKNRPGAAKPRGSELVRRFVEILPFPLTDGQKDVLREITKDLASERPMLRLLQGDVGAGKTVVAAVAAVQTIAAGWQAAFMAPTQILAEQHFRTLSTWMKPLGLRVGLFTSSRKEILQNEDGETLILSAEAATPACDLLVGTHALLYESAPITKLGLAIIDEQHKFGVMQRERLIRRGEAPDVLVMSATPIPRTLTETLHGDLDVSLLRGRPAHRGKVTTVVRPDSALPKITAFLRTQIEQGRQVFIVYPLIDESEKLSAKAAVAEVEKWRHSLGPHGVELLHGRLLSEEKDSLMLRFGANDFPVLVSTTVIEVGVDIPNATVMIIENAERFGLAQLHQMRGRIGRGEHDSWCILVTGKDTDPGDIRLSTLVRSSDGFEIAEADWEFRGPGDMAGTAQSGLPPMRIGDLRRDADLMHHARKLAIKVFEEDPLLQNPCVAALRHKLENEAEEDPCEQVAG